MLKTLTLKSDTQVGSLDLSAFECLQSLYCGEMSALTEVVLPFTQGELTVDISGTGVTDLDLTDIVWLRYLNISETPMRQLTATNINMLLTLYAWGCESLTEVNLSGCGTLMYVHLEDSAVRTLNLTGCGMLSDLYLQNTPITGLDLSSCRWLYDLDIRGTSIRSVSLPFACNYNNMEHGFGIRGELGTTVQFTNHSHLITYVKEWDFENERWITHYDAWEMYYYYVHYHDYYINP